MNIGDHKRHCDHLLVLIAINWWLRFVPTIPGITVMSRRSNMLNSSPWPQPTTREDLMTSPHRRVNPEIIPWPSDPKWTSRRPTSVVGASLMSVRGHRFGDRASDIGITMPDSGVLIAIYQRVYPSPRPALNTFFYQTFGRTLTTNDMTECLSICLPVCLPTAFLSACHYTTIKCILEYILYFYGTQKHGFYLSTATSAP